MRGKKIKGIIERQFATRSHEWIWNTFNDLLLKESFHKFVDKIRADWLVYDKSIHRYRYESPDIQRKAIQEISNKIRQICEKNNLHYTDFVDPIDYYIFYNKVPKPDDFENAYNLCIIEDKFDRIQKSKNKYWQESDDFMYPISIRINPNVGYKMLVDFITKTFNTHLQTRRERCLGDNKIKVLHKRKNTLRDNLIIKYHYEHKKPKTIRKLLEKKNMLLGESEISEVIRRKTKD